MGIQEKGTPNAKTFLQARVALSDDDDLAEVSSSDSKRGLYAKIMIILGQKLKLYGQRKFCKLEDYEESPYDEDCVEGGATYVSSCA